MFQSATLKLTGWYLLILMVISLTFSVAIYSITSREIDTRLTRLQSSFQSRGTFLSGIDDMRLDESTQASNSILLELLYANIMILVSGGIVSYLFARRVLKPLQEIHEAQTRFTSDASHELRTPLAAMKAEIEVTLRDRSANIKDFKAVLASNLEEVEKLTSLSEMLLRLSRLEQDKLEKTAIDLRDITNNVVKLYNPTKRISVEAKGRLLVLANKSAVTELISILVDNSIKHSPTDSKVTITIKRLEDKICFEISNSGRGIDSEDLPHIFDRFYQADISRTSGTDKGYGLGLSLAKRLVELQDGDLAVISGINQKTTFTVLLPIFDKSTR